ncbi:hypothetical protein AURDEDRAFT_116626 [Auricularia subglabra TFB-10046 SS5]|uniref:Uncharacterized protein n=1 Tax=Auricularia subglabra (strain TFB-10046 / SS5) TaxID=717982 RepID=J0DBM4_AURST|nr:hypothetical protein AURDEDRAFT_116626 [Auricularia subglabra TFB-10046 SS5]
MNENDLKFHLDATRARCSALQTRLSATLDALDAAHAARDAEERAARAASAAVRQAEEERDELRDAVALLAEKIEADGDWRVFRPASMRLAEPAEGRPFFDVPPVVDGDDDRAAFVQPLLASLSHQLEAERRRREDAEQQVALLSAQVASREAELEARLDPDPRHDERERMTREAALGVLDLTLARNRALEADVKVLEAKLKALRVYPAESPPPRPSSSRPTLVNSPQKRRTLAPDRVRLAPPISPARSIRELVPPPGPRPTFFSPRRASRPRSSPSPPSTPHSPRAMTPSPVQSPAPQLQRPRTPSPRPRPPPAVEMLDAHLLAIEDGMAELHRERDRLAALPAHAAPADPAHFARVGLLEAECVRLRRRVRELEAGAASSPHDADAGTQHADDGPLEEDPDTTIRPAPRPAPLLPPIELRPSSRASPLGQRTYPAPRPRPPDAPGLHDRPMADAREQRMAQLAAELARAQDGVAERERAMDGLRVEIARLRAAAGA